MFSACILMAGSGTRCGLDYNKVLHKINDIPLFMYSVNAFLKCDDLGEIILVVSEEDFDNYDFSFIDEIKVPVEVVVGGSTRSLSSYIGVDNASYDIVLVHDAARCLIDPEDINNIYQLSKNHDAVISGTKVYDTIKKLDQNNNFLENIDRNMLFASSTPQAVHKDVYLELFENNFNSSFTDEASLYEANKGFDIYYYTLIHDNRKLTTSEDLSYIEYLLKPKLDKKYRIGHSLDTHRLVSGRKFILGGIEIDYPLGFLAHSDGDVLIHAITEAIIGSIALGDIGMHFSDKDPKYKDMDSTVFLKEAKRLLDNEGYEIVNIDSIVYLEKPNLSKYKDLIASNIASILNINKSQVNVKATTKEGLGYIGEGKAVEAECVVLVKEK